MECKKLIFQFLIFLSLLNLGFSAVFISGLDYPTNTNIDSEDFYFNTTLANSETKVFSNLRLKYDIVDSSNFGVVYENYEDFSFAENEVKFVNKQFELEGIPSGDYWFNIILTEKSGAPIAGFKKEITITSTTNKPKLNFKTAPHILALDETGSTVKTSFGSLGNNLPINSHKFVEFTLSNAQDLNLNTKLEIFHSYSLENKLYEKKQDLKLISTQSTYQLPYEYTIPGTYIVKTSFYQENIKLFSKELRMVIQGESASIVSVLNSQDIYETGEVLKLTGILIGPADGASILNDLNLKLEIFENEQLKLTQNQQVNNLGFEPFNFKFTEKLETSLTEYKVKITLTNKELNILDEIELDYEKLTPEYSLTDGTIHRTDFQGCFNDDVCTESEKTIGNCYDCFAKKQQQIELDIETAKKQQIQETLEIDDSTKYTFFESISPNSNKKLIFSTLITLAVLLIAGICFYVITRFEKNE